MTRGEGEALAQAEPPPALLGEGEALPPRGPLLGEALVLALPGALGVAVAGAEAVPLCEGVSEALAEGEAGALPEATALALSPGMVAWPVKVKLADSEATLVGTCVMTEVAVSVPAALALGAGESEGEPVARVLALGLALALPPGGEALAEEVALLAPLGEALTLGLPLEASEGLGEREAEGQALPPVEPVKRTEALPVTVGVARAEGEGRAVEVGSAGEALAGALDEGSWGVLVALASGDGEPVGGVLGERPGEGEVEGVQVGEAGAVKDGEDVTERLGVGESEGLTLALSEARVLGVEEGEGSAEAEAVSAGLGVGALLALALAPEGLSVSVTE